MRNMAIAVAAGIMLVDLGMALGRAQMVDPKHEAIIKEAEEISRKASAPIRISSQVRVSCHSDGTIDIDPVPLGTY